MNLLLPCYLKADENQSLNQPKILTIMWIMEIQDTAIIPKMSLTVKNAIILSPYQVELYKVVALDFDDQGMWKRIATAC